MLDETESTESAAGPEEAAPGAGAAAASAPRFARALLALTGAATLAVAPFAGPALAPADAGHSAHSIPAYLISRISHDVGHNDWAFQGTNEDRAEWVAGFLALGLLWLAVALWMRARAKRFARAEAAAQADTTNTTDATDAPRPRRLWLRVLLYAWLAETVAGLLVLGLGLLASWADTPLDTLPLKLADLCSPWWACVVALLVTARAERDLWSLRATALYGVLLAVLLLVPLPGPDALKALVLAASAAVPAVLTSVPLATFLPRPRRAAASG